MKRNVLKRPLITEKLMSAGEYAFAVDRRATKSEITAAVRSAFAVDPIQVRTLVIKGKTKRSWRKRKIVHSQNWKKAIVKIKKDQKIDIFETKAREESQK